MALSPELVIFVKESLQRGIPRDRVADVLMQAGWPREQVNAALIAFADLDFPIPVPRPVTNHTARDAFTYVVMFGTLVLSGFNLGDLLFELINRAFPDSSVSASAGLQGIRWSLATVIVAFPVFLWLTWTVERAVTRDPTKRASKVRRYTTYITLSIAACALIGDVISVVYNFLGGELTVRFLLKVLTVAIIAGTAFAYYLWDLRQGEKEPQT